MYPELMSDARELEATFGALLDLVDLVKNRTSVIELSGGLTNRNLARGYDLYKKSNFYKQAIQTNKENYKNNLTEKLEQTIKSNQLDNTLISICNNDYIELHDDVKEMKNEIKDLKNSIKELVEMMKAVYDFEDV